MSMLKKLSTRILCVLLATTMSFTLVACDTNNDGKWKVEDNAMDSANELTLVLNEETADKIITASYTQNIFKENISKSDVRLVKYFQMTEEDKENTDFEIFEDINDFDLKFVSAKELKVEFTDNAQNVWMYELVVHKDAVEGGVFAVGDCFPTIYEELPVVPEIQIEGSYTNLTVNPVITVKLIGTDASPNIKADMVTLSGAFDTLKVVSVNVAGKTVHIGTEGNVAQGTSLAGMVTLAEDFTTQNTVLSAATEIEYSAVFIDKASYSFADGKLTFDVVSSQDTFTGSEKISSDKADVNLLSFSEDKLTATLYVEAVNVEEAVAALNTATITLDKTMFTSGNEYKVYASLPNAGLAGNVDYVSIENNNAIVTAYIYASDGKLNELSKTDLSFSGDFADATVESLTKQTDGSYIVKFRFATELENVEDFSLTGKITVSSGKVTNIWGTVSDNNTAQLSYYSLSDRGETWDEIMAFVAANEGTFKTIGTVGSTIGGVASAAKGIYFVLQISGVIESTDDKIDKVFEAIEQTKLQIDQLNRKLDGLESLVTQNAVDEAERDYISQRNQSEMAWNKFLDKVNTLNNTLSRYNQAFYSELLDFVNNPSTELTVYYTSNGEVTLPGPTDGYDINGTKIDAKKTASMSVPFENIKEKLAQNSNEIYAEFLKDIEKNIESDTSLVVSSKDFYNALILSASRNAVDEIGAINIVNDFRNMCYALTGSVAGSPVSIATTTPLQHYYKILSCYYNFASEAEQDMKSMMSWLSGYMLKGASLATFAMSGMSGLTTEEKLSVDNAYSMALKEIVSVDLHQLEAGSQWAFVVNDKIHLIKLNLLKIYGTMSQGYIGYWSDNKYLSFKFNNHINTVNFQIMRNRWQRLYSAGITTSKTFPDYLVDFGLITSDLKTAYLLTEPWTRVKIPLDNSVSLPCIHAKGKQKLFKVGQWYSIGTNGKYKSKHFFPDEITSNQLLGAAYKLSDGTKITRFSAFIRYCDWRIIGKSQSALFDYVMSDPLIAFEIG